MSEVVRGEGKKLSSFIWECKLINSLQLVFEGGFLPQHLKIGISHDVSSIGALLSFMVLYYWLLVCTFAVEFIAFGGLVHLGRECEARRNS